MRIASPKWAFTRMQPIILIVIGIAILSLGAGRKLSFRSKWLKLKGLIIS